LRKRKTQILFLSENKGEKAIRISFEGGERHGKGDRGGGKRERPYENHGRRLRGGGERGFLIYPIEEEEITPPQKGEGRTIVGGEREFLSFREKKVKTILTGR